MHQTSAELFQPTLPGIQPVHRLTVEIYDDPDIECPNDWDGRWKIYSFSNKHRNHKWPSEFGFDRTSGKASIGLRRKLETGTAFLLDYQEHGRCEWSVSGDGPRGYDFDSVRYAGIIICENPKVELKGLSYEEREKSADLFCEVFTCWCNGDAFGWNLYDEEGIGIEGCGGYFGNDTEYMVSEIHAAIRAHTGDERGVKVHVKGSQMADYIWTPYRNSEEEAAWRLGHKDT